MKNLYIILIFPFISISQNQDAKPDIYTLFDNIVGLENMGVYNGKEYREKSNTLDDNHPYFDSSDFLLGSIEYDSQLYFNISMKYNIYNQEVILKLRKKNSSETVIKLYNDKIGSFIINNRKFINVSLNDDDVYAFYEEVFIDSSFSLLIKHKKVKKDLYFEGLMYVEYIAAKKEYFIFSDNSHNELNSKKDIANLFPSFKQNINQFYRDNRLLRKTNYDQFLTKLLQGLKLTKPK